MIGFIVGCMVGGFFGVCMMCVFTLSGECSRIEEKRDEIDRR